MAYTLKQSFQGEIPSGKHICLLHGSEEKRIAVLKKCIQSALQKEERVLCIGSEIPLVSEELYSFGDARIQNCTSNRQLDICSLYGLEFQLKELSLLMIMEVEMARAAGWSNMLFIINISDLLTHGFDTTLITQFEAGLNHLCRISRCRCICQYNYRKLPDSIVLGAIATHPVLAFGEIMLENPYFLVPPPFIGQDSHDFVLEGFVTQTLANVNTIHPGILN